MRKRALQRKAQALQQDITAAESMLLKEDLQHRLRVLRRLGHLEDSGLVTKKGHVRRMHAQLLSCLRQGGSGKWVRSVLMFLQALLMHRRSRPIAALALHGCEIDARFAMPGAHVLAS